MNAIPRMVRGLTVTALVMTGVLSGCAGPLDRDSEAQLREQLIGSHRAYLQAVAAGPVIEVQRAPSDVERDLAREGRIEELDRISGPASYVDVLPELGPNLLGIAEDQRVTISLQRAIQLAVRSNLDVQVARMRPAIAQTQVVRAEAAFDAVFFSDFNYSTLDTPRPPSVIPQFGARQSTLTELTTGIRKPLSSGGQVVAQTRWSRNTENPGFFAIDPYYDADVLVSLQQPLLRNFGSDVNRAEIALARLSREAESETLRRALLEIAEEAERAYWNLALAWRRLQIQTRLYERTVEDRERLVRRRDFDVSPVRITEANSFVELRRADVIRARQQVRTASDALKRLINDRELPIAGEELLLPGEQPADVAVDFSLLDSVTTALRHRPELRRALLSIQDASVRQRVADNQRLPLLNLEATARYNGIGAGFGSAYESIGEGNFIDYIIGLQFEMSIGNRAAEALHRQRTLERRAAVLDYQRAAQDVVLEVKEALRTLITTYELIGATRAARRAASDSLRAIEAQEEAGVALTPEFLLDLKLNAQERLANAEVQEVQALIDYNTAVATLYRVMGTLLERNNIEFSDPQENK